MDLKLLSGLGICDIFENHQDTIQRIKEVRNNEIGYLSDYLIILLSVINCTPDAISDVIILTTKYLKEWGRDEGKKAYCDNISKIQYYLEISKSRKNCHKTSSLIIVGKGFYVEAFYRLKKFVDLFNTDVDINFILDPCNFTDDLVPKKDYKYVSICAHGNTYGFELCNSVISLEEFLLNFQDINTLSQLWCDAIPLNSNNNTNNVKIVVYPDDFSKYQFLKIDKTIVNIRCILFNFGFLLAFGMMDHVSCVQMGKVFEGMVGNDLMESQLNILFLDNNI